MADHLPPPPPAPEWLDRLRAQGRTVTWLAETVGVSRTYLQDVAAGRKRASPALLEAIRAQLGGPDRLVAVRVYAADRVRWQQVERDARRLAESIHAALDGLDA